MELIYSGKVRDIYDAGNDRLVMVTSDRISAFDVVMDEVIPDKGLGWRRFDRVAPDQLRPGRRARRRRASRLGRSGDAHPTGGDVAGRGDRARLRVGIGLA